MATEKIHKAVLLGLVAVTSVDIIAQTASRIEGQYVSKAGSTFTIWAERNGELALALGGGHVTQEGRIVELGEATCYEIGSLDLVVPRQFNIGDVVDCPVVIATVVERLPTKSRETKQNVFVVEVTRKSEIVAEGRTYKLPRAGETHRLIVTEAGEMIGVDMPPWSDQPDFKRNELGPEQN